MYCPFCGADKMEVDAHPEADSYTCTLCHNEFRVESVMSFYSPITEARKLTNEIEDDRRVIL